MKIISMSLLPKIERIVRDATIVHFFLMFGYKLFSLYFPLFLASRGFSLPEVGYTYLLIYLPIAFFAPLVSLLNHKLNPAVLASLGILGYGIYALGMISILNPVVFYFWQLLLGVSAALFFVSSRAILMGFPLENSDRSFAWFYSAPIYADAVAPVVGAFLIWKFNFIGVFISSLVLQFLTAIFCFSRLRKKTVNLVDYGFKIRQLQENYQKIFQKIKAKSILTPVVISFSVLLLAGLYQAFFVLFLKDFGWDQNKILFFGSLLSLLFLPISLFVINFVGKRKSEKNILKGSLMAGLFSILLAFFPKLLSWEFAAFPFLIFLTILIIMLGKSAGVLIAGSGRSGFLTQKLKQYPEETGGIDTMFSPLGTAIGSLISGLLLPFLGYNFLFLAGGGFVVLISIIGSLFLKKNF